MVSYYYHKEGFSLKKCIHLQRIEDVTRQTTSNNNLFEDNFGTSNPAHVVVHYDLLYSTSSEGWILESGVIIHMMNNKKFLRLQC